MKSTDEITHVVWAGQYNSGSAAHESGLRTCVMQGWVGACLDASFFILTILDRDNPKMTDVRCELTRNETFYYALDNGNLENRERWS